MGKRGLEWDRKNKKGFEFSFAWMFALIVGIVIIFLALYFAKGVIQQSTYQRDTEIAKELTILFDPFETGFAESNIATISLPANTRIFNKCSSSGLFGSQIISSSQESFGKWSDPGGEIKVNNRYVFSRDIEEGKKIYIFSKNFEMPFRAGEIIVISSKKYCFKDIPNNIKDEVQNLENVEIGDCSIGSITVCPSMACDIQINDLCSSGVKCEDDFDYGYVARKGSSERMYYQGNLLYAAVFSSPGIYECNLKRLARRVGQLSRLYKDENTLSKSCGNSIEYPLQQLAWNAESLTSSQGLNSLWEEALKVEQLHDNLNYNCRIWVK